MESFQFFVQMSLYCKIDCVCRAQHSQWRRRGWVPSSTKQIDLALKIIWGTAQLHNTLKLEKLTRNFLHLCAIFGEPMLCVSERQPDPKHLPGRQIDLKWYRSSTHCTTATEWSLAVRAFTNWVHHKFTTTTQTIRDPNFLRHFLWWRTCRSSLAKEEEEIVSSCHSSSQGHGERVSPPRTRTQIILWSVSGKFEDLMCIVALHVEKMRTQFQEPVDPTQFGQFVISKLWTLLWTVIIWAGSTYVNVLSPVMMADAFTPSQMLWKQSKVVLGVKALIKQFQWKWKPSAWKQSRVGALDLDPSDGWQQRHCLCFLPLLVYHPQLQGELFDLTPPNVKRTWKANF